MEKLQLHIKHICLLRIIAKSPDNKIKFEKKIYANTFSKFVVAIHFNLLQVCPSVPQVFHFLCYLSLPLTFWVVTFFFVISQFDDSSHCWNFGKFDDAAPLSLLWDYMALFNQRHRTLFSP